MTKDEAQEKLEIYNQNVADAIKQRTEFMNKNMHLFAEFQIGDIVYNVKSGQATEVVEHYRFWSNQNPYYDTSFSTHCRFKNGDNTSCYSVSHPYVLFHDKELRSNKYIQKLESVSRC
ncbi:MAG: hypothetical protein Q8910_00185 [Bacteroidota bacterium]|nr:hypothetical protein [Bacteroidota bacterium]